MKTNEKNSRLRVMFLVTSMPVGGAETLLLNLVRRLDRERFAPEIACLKERGPLGEELAREMPVHHDLISNKYDVFVLWRLWRLMRIRQIDAVVTVGAGDKMFWGRLAANLAGVPVIVSALHSTGWPDSVGKLNRWLTPITDAFIGVADAHGQHLVEHERFPADKVQIIYNGVDTKRFCPGDKPAVLRELGLPADAKVVAILAALRPEKNHEMFLVGAAQILRQEPNAIFLVIGDGPLRSNLEQLAEQLGVAASTQFLGSRPDVERILQAVDVLALTSHNEASPVSILEGLSCGVPCVASNVGSVSETVIENVTGKLFPAGDQASFVQAVLELLGNEPLREQMGTAGRQAVIDKRSLDSMVNGYDTFLTKLYAIKTKKSPQTAKNTTAKAASLSTG
ncbi:MAG: glycosyltransferase [Bythopirellula sp.]|nr:glycosyltransferase [Bythopirellula sp.]